MAAGGLMYSVSFENTTISNAVQDIWELVAAAGVSLVIHSVKLTVAPTISSGIAQDVRIRLMIQHRTTTGSGGTAQTPVAVNQRNTVAAVTSCHSGVTTPGTASGTGEADLVSIIVPYERTFTPDQRNPISGGNRWNLSLLAAPGATYQASSTVYFEEI